MITSLPTAVVTDDKLVVLSIRMLLRRHAALLLEDSARGGCQLPASPVASSVHPDALLMLLSTISCLEMAGTVPRDCTGTVGLLAATCQSHLQDEIGSFYCSSMLVHWPFLSCRLQRAMC